jgi:predicted negative regulator of RcsB-dependent stress response
MAQTKKPMAVRLKPKETDEFISFSTKLLNFAQRNLTYILVGLVVLLLAGALWGYLQKRQFDHQEKAAELYQAAVAQKKSDTTIVLKELQTIIQDYPGTGGALQARLLTANLLFQEKKYSEAAAAFQALGQESLDLNLLVAENLSYCYEAQKDYPKAAAVLAPLVETADLSYRQELQRRQALMFELAGDPAKALAVYQKMLQDNPSENFVPYLQEKIKSLEAKKS